MEHNIFFDFSILLAITACIAFFVRLLRQPIMVAYLIAGIVAGPLFLNVLHGNGAIFEALGQFGVILLLFVVGLNFNITHIKSIGKTVSIAGTVQMLFTALAGFILLTLLGIPRMPAVYLSLAMTFSSTIIIVKLLSDKKDTETVYGRHALGLMVIQDIFAITLMIFLTSLSKNEPLSSLISLMFFKASAIIVAVAVLARFVVPRIITRVARSGDLLFIFAISWCFVIATAMHAFGLSMEIGAIIAGVALGSSPFHTDIASRIRPLRDFFIILFFLMLGSKLTATTIFPFIIPATILSLFIIFGNPFILYHTYRALHFSRRNSFHIGVIAAQVSEFGFVLLLTGVGLGHINESYLSLFTLVALSTIILSSYAITHAEKIYQALRPIFMLFGEDRHVNKETVEHPHDVWLFGYHRMGEPILHSLKRARNRVAVADYNPDAIFSLKKQHVPVYFGDIADIDFLETLKLEKAKLIISTVPTFDDQLTAIRYIRSINTKAVIIATLYHKEGKKELEHAGATLVLFPHLLGGEWIAHMLKEKKWTKQALGALKYINN